MMKKKHLTFKEGEFSSKKPETEEPAFIVSASI
jgi:hypothetical protein